MKKLLLKIQNWFTRADDKELKYPVLYLKSDNTIKSTRFNPALPIVGFVLTDEIIYYPLAKDNSYSSDRDGFYHSRYYGTWKEAQAFFEQIKIPGYKVAAAPINTLVKILDDYRKINPLLKKFNLEPLHEDWYYWSGTSYWECDLYAWDYCNDRTGNKMDESSRSAYLKTEKNHFLGILIPE